MNYLLFSLTCITIFTMNAMDTAIPISAKSPHVNMTLVYEPEGNFIMAHCNSSMRSVYVIKYLTEDVFSTTALKFVPSLNKWNSTPVNAKFISHLKQEIAKFETTLHNK